MADDPATASLRQEVEEAVADAVRLVGPGAAIDKIKVVQQFLGRGASRATLYRWVNYAIDSGRAGNAVAHKIKRMGKKRFAEKQEKDRAERRVKRRVERRKKASDEPQSTSDVAAEAIGEVLPTAVDVAQIVAAQGTVGVIEYLRKCIETAMAVIEYASGPDGKPRAPKLLLAASEHLRRCMETAQRIHERIYELQRIEDFHRQIIEEVRKESPTCAQRILARLDSLSRQFGAM